MNIGDIFGAAKGRDLPLEVSIWLRVFAVFNIFDFSRNIRDFDAQIFNELETWLGFIKFDFESELVFVKPAGEIEGKILGFIAGIFVFKGRNADSGWEAFGRIFNA